MRQAFVFEHQRIRIGDVLGEAGHFTEQHFAALCQVNAHHKGAFELGHRSLRFTQHVGLVQISGLSLVILPKLKRAAREVTNDSWRFLLEHMVETVLRPHPLSPTVADTKYRRSHLLDIVAAQFLDEVDRIRSRGLVRGYHDLEENRSVLRGRLLIARNIRINAAHAERFYIRHEVHDFDTPPNRILLAALRRIAALPVSGRTRVRARQCIDFFPALSRLRESDSVSPLPRQAQHYQRGLSLARALLQAHLPSLSAGGSLLFALLFDMNVLFEDYVTILMRRAGLDVQAQARLTFLKKPRRIVKPDLLLRGDPTLVLDTKWKLPKGSRPTDADLKQMYVYNHITNAAQAVLLYPETPDSNPWSGVFFDGRRLSVSFVPLLFEGRPDAHKVQSALCTLVETHRTKSFDQG